MAVFVIARSNAKDLDTVLFSAGADDAAEAAAVFTEGHRAQEYIADADWSDSHTVVEIAAEELCQWLCNLQRDGIQHLAVNPTRATQRKGGHQAMVTIRSELELAGELLSSRIRPLEPRSDSEQFQQVALHHCQICGKVFRVRPNEPAPICCDRPAEKAATDTERLTTA